MLKPTDIERIKGKNSRYAVVVGWPSAPVTLRKRRRKRA